jgi:hypothetical protein
MLHRRDEAVAAFAALLENFAEGETAILDEYLALARARRQKLVHPTPWQ